MSSPGIAQTDPFCRSNALGCRGAGRPRHQQKRLWEQAPCLQLMAWGHFPLHKGPWQDVCLIDELSLLPKALRCSMGHTGSCVSTAGGSRQKMDLLEQERSKGSEELQVPSREWGWCWESSRRHPGPDMNPRNKSIPLQRDGESAREGKVYLEKQPWAVCPHQAFSWWSARAIFGGGWGKESTIISFTASLPNPAEGCGGPDPEGSQLWCHLFWPWPNQRQLRGRSLMANTSSSWETGSFEGLLKILNMPRDPDTPWASSGCRQGKGGKRLC